MDTLTRGGIMPLLDGGRTTLRSGFRLARGRLPPVGRGDLVGMTFPKLFAPGLPTKPFPVQNTQKSKGTLQCYKDPKAGTS